MNDKNHNWSSITKDEWSEQQKEARGNDGFISSCLSWVSERMSRLKEGNLVEQKNKYCDRKQGNPHDGNVP